MKRVWQGVCVCVSRKRGEYCMTLLNWRREGWILAQSDTCHCMHFDSCIFDSNPGCTVLPHEAQGSDGCPSRFFNSITIIIHLFCSVNKFFIDLCRFLQLGLGFTFTEDTPQDTPPFLYTCHPRRRHLTTLPPRSRQACCWQGCQVKAISWWRPHAYSSACIVHHLTVYQRSTEKGDFGRQTAPFIGSQTHDPRYFRCLLWQASDSLSTRPLFRQQKYIDQLDYLELASYLSFIRKGTPTLREVFTTENAALGHHVNG